uniref:Uncharacterized protein n=1 Tax=Cercocebus atys TaxID=9531 RepID=A0A2K5MEP2_CERAT
MGNVGPVGGRGLQGHSWGKNPELQPPSPGPSTAQAAQMGLGLTDGESGWEAGSLAIPGAAKDPSTLLDPVQIVFLLKRFEAGRDGSRLSRRVDHLRSGVRNLPGQHGETPSLLKIQKLARRGGACL